MSDSAHPRLMHWCDAPRRARRAPRPDGPAPPRAPDANNNRETTFSFSDPATGVGLMSFCPGGVYTVEASFPTKRLALLTATAGTLSDDPRCLNRIISGDKALYSGFSANITVPCSSAGAQRGMGQQTGASEGQLASPRIAVYGATAGNGRAAG